MNIDEVRGPAIIGGLLLLVLWSKLAVAVDQLDLVAGYEGISEQASGLSGLSDERVDLGVVRALWQRQIQDRRLLYTIAATAEGGGAQSHQARFGNMTLRPQVKAEFGRQVHRLEATGSWSYDQMGLLRRSLQEQWDQAFLTPLQRRRSRYGSVGSDHWVQLGPQVSLHGQLASSYLDQGVITKNYGGGGYLEYGVTEALRLRLGAAEQLYFFDKASVRSQGPELSGLYQVTRSCDLELKAGLSTVTDRTGSSQGLSGKAVLQDERGDFGARLSWEKGLVSQLPTSQLSTSDTYSLALHSAMDRQNTIEFAAEQRAEEWTKGFAGVTPADTMKSELRYIYQVGGASWWLPGRGAWNMLAAYGVEQLRSRGGEQGARQVIRFSVERVL